MEICVVGAGVIGCIYGQVFYEAGHRVTHFVRPGRGRLLVQGMGIDLLDARGATLTARDVVYRPSVIERLDSASAFDLILVGVRHDQLEPLFRSSP